MERTYTGSENMGFVIITLELIKGTSANPFNVTVTPSEQSPVSAQGNSVMCMIMCWLKSVWLTGGVDFDTTPLTATFDSGMTMSNISVPVIDDDIVEQDEIFHVILSISPSVHEGIIVMKDRDNSTVTITDSTSTCSIIFNSLSMNIFNSCCKYY